MKLNFIYIILVIIVVSCKQSDNEPIPIAKVGDKILYNHELNDFKPSGLDKQDSTLWADDFITKWVKKELLILKAETNLTSNQKDVQKELDEYRNSLITYRYKNELMKQKMDTVVSLQEIEKYYNQHQEKFNLLQDILKAIYIKMPIEVADKKLLKSLCMDEDPNKIAELNEFCLSYAKSYDRFNDHWVAASLVLDNTPVEIDNLDRFLRRNKFIESEDLDYYYLVCIRDFRFAGQAAPIDYVENQVKNLILNARKIHFLKKIEEDVYNEGIENNRVKIFK